MSPVETVQCVQESTALGTNCFCDIQIVSINSIHKMDRDMIYDMHE